jgi:hypothetical protein
VAAGDIDASEGLRIIPGAMNALGGQRPRTTRVR